MNYEMVFGVAMFVIPFTLWVWLLIRVAKNPMGNWAAALAFAMIVYVGRLIRNGAGDNVVAIVLFVILTAALVLYHAMRGKESENAVVRGVLAVFGFLERGGSFQYGRPIGFAVWADMTAGLGMLVGKENFVGFALLSVGWICAATTVVFTVVEVLGFSRSKATQ